MIVEYMEGKFIDIDRIVALAPEFVILEGGSFRPSKEAYEVIKRAFKWARQDQIYNSDMKKGEK